ncbi:MAG: hypothetical protein WCT77_03765 [Bacteroidota bacterium]|jgi:hypothetical protein
MSKEELKQDYFRLIDFPEDARGIPDDLLRVYMSVWNYPGNPDKQSIEIDKAINKQYSLFDFNRLIWDTIPEIETLLAKKYPDVINNVFAGENPDPIANANIIRCQNGFLILFNSGFLFKIYTATIIICRSLFYDKEIFKGIDNNEQAPSITNELAIKSFLELVKDESKIDEELFEEKSEYKTMVIFELIFSCVRFVLAHEYGHVHSFYYPDEYKEKVENMVKYLINYKSLNEFTARRWTEELKAEGFALDYVMQRVLSMRDDLDSSNYFDINAPVYLFALENLLEKIKPGMCIPLELSSYPDFKFRLEGIRYGKKADTTFALADYLVKHIKMLEELILNTKN